MDVKLKRSYRSKAGNRTFVYGVSGTESELTQFAAIHGEYQRTDDESGEPLWFTTKCIGDAGKLIITTNGNVVPDMSAFDAAASMAEQYGGNLGQELAKSAAQLLLSNKAPAPAVAAPAPVAVAENTDVDDL